jgi:hypothetical protein
VVDVPDDGLRVEGVPVAPEGVHLDLQPEKGGGVESHTMPTGSPLGGSVVVVVIGVGVGCVVRDDVLLPQCTKLAIAATLRRKDEQNRSLRQPGLPCLPHDSTSIFISPRPPAR